MPDYRETIIRLDHGARTAEVWTAERGLKTRLKRLGAKDLRDGWQQIPITYVRFSKGRGAPGRPFVAGPRTQGGSQRNGGAS